MKTDHHFETTDGKNNSHKIVVQALTKGYSWVIDGKGSDAVFYESDLAEKFERLRRMKVAVTYKGSTENGTLNPDHKQPLWSLEFVEKKSKRKNATNAKGKEKK